MAVETQAEQAIEMEVVLNLAATEPVGRQALEEATMEVQGVLDEHVLASTQGASASANFEMGCIELDIILTGATMSELYQVIALIVTQLDRYCRAINIAPLPAGGATPLSVMVQGSYMRRVGHEPGRSLATA
jgi:hypothetical protein